MVTLAGTNSDGPQSHPPFSYVLPRTLPAVHGSAAHPLGLSEEWREVWWTTQRRTGYCAVEPLREVFAGVAALVDAEPELRLIDPTGVRSQTLPYLSRPHEFGLHLLSLPPDFTGLELAVGGCVLGLGADAPHQWITEASRAYARLPQKFSSFLEQYIFLTGPQISRDDLSEIVSSAYLPLERVERIDHLPAA